MVVRLLSVTVAVAMGSALAVLAVEAQPVQTPPGVQTPAPPTAPAESTQAPVGHRQPRADEVPPPQADAEERKDEARMRRVLDSICRGC